MKASIHASWQMATETWHRLRGWIDPPYPLDFFLLLSHFVDKISLHSSLGTFENTCGDLKEIKTLLYYRFLYSVYELSNYVFSPTLPHYQPK